MRKALKKLLFRIINPVCCFVVLCFLYYTLNITVYKLSLVKDANALAVKVSLNDFAVYDSVDNGDNQDLMTLFTTFKDVPGRVEINKLTVDTWSALPRVKTVMFTETNNSTVLKTYAQKKGWLVFQAPNLRQGYPVLKDMFLYVKKKVSPQTRFMAYANSDIIFTSDLTDTLMFLSQIDQQYYDKNGLLASGRRINTLVSLIKEIAGTHHMSNRDPDAIIYDAEDVIDYFITTPNGFPWDKVPNFVIGKPGYDNWLLKKAVDWNIVTIDTSETVTAFHQTYNATHTDKGWLSKNVCMNRDLVDVDGYFPYYMGRTACLKYVTKFTHAIEENKTSNDESHLNDLESLPKESIHIDLLIRKGKIKLCMDKVIFPFTGLFRKYNMCADIARKKSEESEKFMLNMRTNNS